MFGMGMTEILIIMALALLVLGPSKLPEVARALGKGLQEFRSAAQDINTSIHAETKAGTVSQKPKPPLVATDAKNNPAEEEQVEKVVP